MHIAVSYLALELRGAAHARLVAPSLAQAIPLRARLSVGRSAARGTRPRRGSDPSPPAQAPESPYFPRFEAELGEMSPNALSRYGSAMELLAWLPILVGHTARGVKLLECHPADSKRAQRANL